jgi:hypothetical protein
MNYELFTGEAERSRKMKRNLLVLVVMIVAMLFFTPPNSGAQCPEDENDLGICDTLYVETFDCDHEYNAEPGSFDSVRVAIYVTHDSNTFWWEDMGKWLQDSIAAFVVPLKFWHQPLGCADSVILPNWDNWNNTVINPNDPRMSRSIFRHIVDEHTGDTVYNRLLDLASQGNAWDYRIVDIEPHSCDGDSGHAWMSLYAGSKREWYEGSRVLLATLTFHVYMSEDCDTTEIGIDSMFWPPFSRLAFTRYDAKNYFPRHFLPVCDTIYSLPVNHPPVLSAIGNHKFNEGDYIVLNVSAFDLDGDSLVLTASNLPERASFSGENGVFLWTPTYTQYGTYPNIHFEVSDGKGGVDSEDITIEILNYPKGDVNADRIVNVCDIVYLINYLFIDGPAPNPLEAGDVNCSGLVSVTDVVYLINYLFINGPPPYAPPSPSFILPHSNGILNGLAWVCADNLSDTPVQQVEFQYSSDSLQWTDLIFDEQEPSTEWDPLGETYGGFWNTEILASGKYWLRVIISDTIHGLQGIETIPVLINKKPVPHYAASYDSSTGMVIFDGSASSDTDGTVIWYNWIFCDSTVMQGQVVHKEFAPGDTCQVSLTVFDNYYNWAANYGRVVYQEGTVLLEAVDFCECVSIRIRTDDKIPQNPPFTWGKNTRRPNPAGDDALGPVDWCIRDTVTGEILFVGSKYFFMIEADIKGNPDLCSTAQFVARTFLYDGDQQAQKCDTLKKGGTPCPYDKNNPCNPQNRPPTLADLCPDGYFQGCGPFKNLSLSLQKIPNAGGGGTIRWLDAPGPFVAKRALEPKGMEWYAYFLSKVIDYPGCSNGKCKICYTHYIWYGSDGHCVQSLIVDPLGCPP